MVTTPNYRNGIGRLATDRYDFQNHIDGYGLNHSANVITINTPLPSPLSSATTVQEALVSIAPLLTPSIPDAGPTTKGLITLSGDIGGSGSLVTAVKVTGIQGRSILSTPPTSGSVLSFNGSAWEPTAAATQLDVGGDLTGNTADAAVVSIHGDADYLNVAVNCKNIKFASTLSPVSISQSQKASGTGSAMAIAAQSSLSGAGGDLLIGPGTGSTLPGALSLIVNGTTYLQAAERISGKSVLSLLGSFTSTNMPANTGNGVIFVKDATAVPTSGSPVGGSVLYSSSGKLGVKQSNGTGFTIKSVINQTVFFDFNGQPLSDGMDPYIYSTSSGTYQEALTTNTYSGLTDDFIKVFFTGSVSGKGKIKLSLYQDSLGANVDITGTEMQFDTTFDGYAIPISIVGGFTLVDDDVYYSRVMMYADSGTVYLYGGATLMYEAIRPSP